MVTLLQDYIDFLKNAETEVHQHHPKNYHLPSEIVLPEEWAEFDHAYQLHCPNLSLDNATRDVRILRKNHTIAADPELLVDHDSILSFVA